MNEMRTIVEEGSKPVRNPGSRALVHRRVAEDAEETGET